MKAFSSKVFQSIPLAQPERRTGHVRLHHSLASNEPLHI
jgi:hypothetical protein